MARQECDYYGVKEWYRDYSANFVANVAKSVNMAISGYKLVNVMAKGGYGFSKPPSVMDNDTVYFWCDSTVNNFPIRAYYVKASELGTI